MTMQPKLPSTGRMLDACHPPSFNLTIVVVVVRVCVAPYTHHQSALIPKTQLYSCMLSRSNRRRSSALIISTYYAHAVGPVAQP
jgi:hypothetical protein